MRIRNFPLLLVAASVLLLASCKEEKETVWTLREMAGSRIASLSISLDPLDSIVGEPAYKPEAVRFPSESASLTLGSDEKMVTLRFERIGLRFLEIPLRQMTKIGKVAYLELTETPLSLKYPVSSDEFDATAILKSSRLVPDPKNGPYSVEFQTQAGTMRIRLKMEILFTPKPGVKREKQHYGGYLLIDIKPKS